jgi:DNA-binding NtrC family response regulator
VDIPRGHGETVLVVEDNAAFLELVGKMLTDLGYKVLNASSPTLALKQVGERPGGIDLLMTDVVMPEMNGRHLAGQLEALHPKLKVLFMSGFTANAIAHQGVLDEGICFLQKPFSMKDLGYKVSEALRGE